ncbi:malate dehydrogenase (quinone) [Neokomagataea thailandica]|uniref:Probable malate:quinone oxidoreductase n=1 Tax=Neokomagataea tanensis NBRC 106556 TaxID=1223519 RepID=A0ABQ0QIU9_9PROT|nr:MULTISPECIES: malate dehydrogenase (quinone) [Neokomagataea]GBR46380.1 malate:quinone oxidoreductase [Neokomagataea tanensis NBRC 106556]
MRTLTSPDLVLIGAGIMSATFAALLQEVAPHLNIVVLEGLPEAGLESSNAWNNAGTGHAAYCELNYTPMATDGSIAIDKALSINTDFDLSRQLWAHWVRNNLLPSPEQFITNCPHIALVHGHKDVAFLKKRYEALSAHHCFAGMEYSEDPATITSWAPLAMEGRNPSEPVAATRVLHGTDVNFGTLTRSLFKGVTQKGAVQLLTEHRVTRLKRSLSGQWSVTARSPQGDITFSTRCVFIGAGGATLPLLQQAKLPEAKGYAGFPVSGIWMKCTNPDVISRHHAKVYGMAPVGAPPMSVPHLDTRIIDGKNQLLFGPYAGFTTRFLKTGAPSDYVRSLKADNLWPALSAGLDNLPLVRYLMTEIVQSDAARMAFLHGTYPLAQPQDWNRVIAGQRVQIIRPEGKGRGVLKLGTEVIKSADGTLSAVLGASPGASVSAGIILKLLTAHADSLGLSKDYTQKLKTLLPSYGLDLATHQEACHQIRQETAAILNLNG